MEPIKYASIYIRLTAGGIVSFLLLFVDCWRCIPYALTDPSFYLTYSVSFALATALMGWVHWITIRFDNVCDWKSASARRIVIQLFLGVVLTAGFDYAVMSAYLLGTGQTVNYIKFQEYFPAIILFIVILNLYYLIHYLFVNWRRAEQRQEPSTQNFPVIEIRSAGIIADVPLDEVMFFYSLNKKVYLRTIIGEEHRINSKLADIVDQYGQYDFFQINPSVIINRAITNGYRGKDRYLKRIILKSEFADKIKEADRNKLEVTRKWIPVARKWFGKELKDPDDNQSSEKK